MYYDVQKSAERIRDLRADNNLTQSEAAERMGFSLSGYRKLEQGQNGGSIDSLIMVADYWCIAMWMISVCGMRLKSLMKSGARTAGYPSPEHRTQKILQIYTTQNQ